MKKVFLSLAFLLLFQMNYAQDVPDEQEDYDVSVLSISVIMPENVEGLSPSLLSKLEAKILRMVTTYGLSGNGYNSNFVIYPKFEIYNEDYMSGMETMTSIETELNLFVKQLDNNKMFASYAKSSKGISKNRDQAIKNAIQKLPTKSRELEEFIGTAKQRIVRYYETRCDDIISEAESYSQRQMYEEAIGILMTIPSDISDCFNQAQEKAIEYYRFYAAQRCKEMLQKALAAEAGRNYGMALTYLSEVDPSTECAEQSLELLNRISGKVDEDFQRRWDFLMQQYRDSQILQRRRIDAMVEIAKAYYRRTQPTYHITYKSLF